ncbi:MAG: ubiquinol-cytochrome c reductase iron-sulfur subunit [Candidatus Nitrosomirales archaeon]
MSPLKIILLIAAGTVAANTVFYSFLFLTNPVTEPQTLIHIPRAACNPDRGTSDAVIRRVIIGINNTITWKNWGSCSHRIVAETFSSEILNQNQTWSYTFAKEGVYQYHTEPSALFKGKIVALSESSLDKIIINDQNLRFANIDDIKPDSSRIFFYPITKDDTWSTWLLIRLPESLGGDKNDESAFRAYSMVDIRLHCLVRYIPEKLQMGEPCHGSFYDVLNGVAVTGPAVDYNFPNNALPRLELFVDDSGFIHVKPPEFTVERNGVIGYGRIPDVKSIQQ